MQIHDFVGQDVIKTYIAVLSWMFRFHERIQLP